jgi:N-methylhydantoinase A
LQRSGANVANARIAETADMRYVGQSHELTVPLDGQRVTASTLSQVSKDFTASHERVYGHSDPEGQVEVISLRVTVILPQKAPLVRRTADGAHRAGQRDVYLPEVGGYEAIPIVPRNAIDGAFDGPAIVTQDDTTIVVRAGWRVRAAEAGGPLVLYCRE